jgi:DNA-binding NarL/FixJ family response regulator
MKIVVVDDHLIVRDLLCEICARNFGHTIVAKADTGPEAVERILATSPDVVLLDIQLPELDGFAVIESIRRAGCRSRVLLLSGSCDDRTIYLVEHAQVQGFMDKPTSASAALGGALSAVGQGGSYFSPAFRDAQKARRANPCAFDKLLSSAEQRLLLMFGALLTDAEIAERLQISELTVEKHRFNIRGKLNLGSRVEFMRYILDHGFMRSPLGSGCAGNLREVSDPPLVNFIRNSSRASHPIAVRNGSPN